MRGGCHILAAVGLCLAVSACAAPASGPEPEPKKPKPAEPAAVQPPDPEPVYKIPGANIVEPGGIKGVSGVVPAKMDISLREPGFDQLLRLQKEIVGRSPSSDDEKLRLALLYATAGKLEEADQTLSTVKSRTNKLVPYVELYLRRQLGDHKEAGKLLTMFNEEERLATGFVIERAELCSQIRRFRDYTPAEGDRVRPGGWILLYIEPRNFALQRNQDKHILHLKYEWKLYDDRSAELQVPTWDQAPLEEREDQLTVNGTVSEFYQSFKLPLPANLAMGHYRVRVTVTDAHSGKSDRVNIPIYVTAVESKR
jgi:hypothetical protein